MLGNMPLHFSAQAIRTPTFCRFARIDSHKPIPTPKKNKKKPIFEALGHIRANRVFSPIRIQIRVICVQSSLLSIFWKVDSQKKKAFSEARIDSREGMTLKKHINKFSPPTQSRDNPANLFMFISQMALQRCNVNFLARFLG